MKTNILLTGGSGLLGIELQKYLNVDAPTHGELDITNITAKNIAEYGNPKIIIHCAAYTDVVGAKEEKEECFRINVFGTKELIQRFAPDKFIYISSEYAFNPTNFYAWSKKAAEEQVKRYIPKYLIIRTSFVSKPFPHEFAFFDQYTQGDYIDVIASMIAHEILKDTIGEIYVGTKRKTMFELARLTNPDIKAISVDDIKTVKLPHDYE